MHRSHNLVIRQAVVVQKSSLALVGIEKAPAFSQVLLLLQPYRKDVLI